MGIKRITGTLAAAGLCAATIAGTIAGTALSQDRDENGGVVVTLDVSSNLRSNSNPGLNVTPPGSRLRFDTSFGLGVTSRTRTQRFDFELQGTLAAEDGQTNLASNAADNGLVRQSLSFGYDREAARSNFSFDVAYNRAEVDGFSTIFDPALGATLLIADDGERSTFTIGTELVLGTEGPLTTTLGLSTRRIDFDGTSDPSLFKRTSTNARVQTVFRISPVLEGRARYSVTRYDAEDATNTERVSRGLSFGLDYAVSAVTDVTFNAGTRWIDSSVNGESDGSEWSLAIERDLPRGSVRASLSSDFTAAGRRDDLNLSRVFDLPGAELEVAVGLTNAPGGGDQEPSLRLAYSQEFARGSLSVSLSRQVVVDDDAEAQSSLRGGLNYTHALDARSQISFNASYLDIAPVGGSTAAERQGSSIGATFSRSLAQDWALSVGAERRYLDDASGSASDNAFFVGLSRSFEFRP